MISAVLFISFFNSSLSLYVLKISTPQLTILLKLFYLNNLRLIDILVHLFHLNLYVLLAYKSFF